MKIPVNKIFWILTAVVLGLLAIYTFTILSGKFFALTLPEFIVARFNINGEANIPTWYSTILLFSVSAASLLIYGLSLRLPKNGQRLRAFWLGFGSVYAFFSLDEAAMIHEIFDRLTLVKWFYVYAPVIGLFYLASFYYFFVVRKEDHAVRNWIIGGLVVFAFGGIACEWYAYTFPMTYAARQIEYVLEEGSEMIGTVMVLMGCLLEFKGKFSKVFSAAAANPDAAPN